MLAPARTTIRYRNPSASAPLILPVHVVCNTPDELLHANIRVNSRRPGRWVESLPAHEGVAILCGSGPSLNDCIEEIRAHKGTIFALNGAASHLAAHGIVADYQVMIDARERTAELVGPAKMHLFASQCHPKCWERAPDARVWHLQVEGIEDLFPVYPHGYALIGGAASVGNTAACLAYALGFRELHCYGYDSSHRDDRGHAFRQALNDGDPITEIDWNGRTYRASITMKLQAERFPVTAAALESMGARVYVHGSGLLPDIYNTPAERLGERDKYRKMWMQPAYRRTAPGEGCAADFIARCVPRGTCIDFGCGTGRGALAISAHCDVQCVDFAENCRDAEAQHLPFLAHDLTEPLPVSADFGYCTDVMEHIPTADVEAVLANITTAAKTVYFQISTVPDEMGSLINQRLHLTVRPHEWWAEKLSRYGRVTHARDEGAVSVFVLETQPQR